MTKKKIIIIGTGEQARVTIDNVEEQNKYEIFGLIASDKEKDLSKKVYGYNILCTDKDLDELLQKNRDIKSYVLGLGISVGGSLTHREKIYSNLDNKINSVNIIHPTANISKRAKIGKGNIIESYTKICNDVVIGNHCLIQSFSSINHDQKLGNNIMIACNVTLAGKTINDHSIIAEGSSIGFKKNVGKNCLLMDGSVLTKDMPDNTIGYGNPAKIINKNNKILSNFNKKDNNIS